MPTTEHTIHPVRATLNFTNTCAHIADQEVEDALVTLLQTAHISVPCCVTHISEISAYDAAVPDTCYVRLGDINGTDALWIFLRTSSDKYFRILLRIEQAVGRMRAIKQELQRKNSAIQRAIFTFFDRAVEEMSNRVTLQPGERDEPAELRPSTHRFTPPNDELCAHIMRTLVMQRAHNGVVVKKGVGGVLAQLHIPASEGRTAVSLGHTFRTCCARGYFEPMRGQPHATRITSTGVRFVLDTLGPEALDGLREGYVSDLVRQITAPDANRASVDQRMMPQNDEEEYVMQERLEGPLSRLERHTHALEAVQAMLLTTVRALDDSKQAETLKIGLRTLFTLTLHGVRHPGTVTRENIDRSTFEDVPTAIVEQVLAFLPED